MEGKDGRWSVMQKGGRREVGGNDRRVATLHERMALAGGGRQKQQRLATQKGGRREAGRGAAGGGDAERTAEEKLQKRKQC